MKIVTLISLLLILFLNSNAQDLTYSEKKIWRKALKNMEETDQFYRQIMKETPELNNDSIWGLQTTLDSINKVKFIELTELYGYPSRKNIGQEASIALLLHFTNEQDYNGLKELFKSELNNGNMLPVYYAWWYDRCLRNMNKPIYYGQYTNKKEFCGDEWTAFNEHRKEIGLAALKGKAICE